MSSAWCLIPAVSVVVNSPEQQMGILQPRGPAFQSDMQHSLLSVWKIKMRQKTIRLHTELGAFRPQCLHTFSASQPSTECDCPTSSTLMPCDMKARPNTPGDSGQGLSPKFKEEPKSIPGFGLVQLSHHIYEYL